MRAAPEETAKKKFFVLGCPRSGTTVLQQALNRHSRVVVPAETKYFYYYYGMPRRWQQRHLARMQADLQINLELSGKPAWSTAEHREIFDEIARQCVTRSGKSNVAWFGDKTPEHTNRIESIRRVYPECPVIFIHRDPRDVAVSLKEVPWIKCGAWAAAYIWRRYNETLLDLRRQQDEFLFSVSYESLVTDPDSTLRSICEFLGVDYESSMATGKGDQTVIPERELAWKSRSLGTIGSSRVGRWKQELTAAEISRIERIDASVMTELGYQLGPLRRRGISLAEMVPCGLDLGRAASSLTIQCLLSEAFQISRGLKRKITRQHGPTARKSLVSGTTGSAADCRSQEA